MMRFAWVVAVFLGGAVVFFISGLSERKNDAAFLSRARETTGVVLGYTKLNYYESDPSAIMYVATIRYTTTDGQTLTNQAKRGNNQRPFAIGERIPVLYDPQEPNHVDPKKYWTGWNRIPLGWVLSAILFVAGALWVPLMLLGKRLLQTFQSAVTPHQG